MSRRRVGRLLRTATLAAVAWWTIHHSWAWWVALPDRYQAAIGMFLSVGVLMVWGLTCCLREHRAEQARARRDRLAANRTTGADW